MAKNFCLLPSQIEKFKKDLVENKITISDLLNKTTEEVTAILEPYAGKNAADIATLFEQKLILKNKTIGVKNAIKKLTESGIYSKSEVERIQKAKSVWRAKQIERILNPQENEKFLNALADKIVGTHVDRATAQQIFQLSKAVTEADMVLKEKGWSKERGLAFGAAKVAYDNLVTGGKKVQDYSFINPLTEKGVAGKAFAAIYDVGQAIKFIGSNTRSLVAAVDNSLWGNQGIRVFLDPKYSKVWAKDFLKSIQEFATIMWKGNKTADDIMDAGMSEIYGRENYFKGRYQNKGGRKLDIGTGEEAFPTSLPSRMGEIPVLSKIPVVKQILNLGGRVFKASEVVYELGAMRLRADIADKMYDMAEQRGEVLDNPKSIGSYNTIINEMTGRGYVGKHSELSDLANSVFFSVRFFKSHLDFLTMNAFDPAVSVEGKKESFKQLLRVISITAVILAISKGLSDDDAYDPFDPRSSDFGKIKIGNTRISLGAYTSIVVLVSKILSKSYRDTTTGEIKPLNEKDKKGMPKFGAPTGLTAFWDFTENKFSPLMGLLADLAKDQQFDRTAVTPASIVKQMTTPMSKDAIADMFKDNSNGLFLDFLLAVTNFNGFNANTYPPREIKNKK